MSEKKPPLKLRFGSFSAAAKPEAVPKEEPPTPASATSKITLKLGKKPSAPQGPTATPPATKTTPAKPGRRATKPTPKKRAAEEATQNDSDSDHPTEASNRQFKKLKLTTKSSPTPRTPTFLKVKAKGNAPPRPLGVGYDSEAEDREKDPTITDNIILRMMPGEDCDYLRKAVAERRFGPVKEGGADVRMRFLTKDGRRAVITIRGRMYAAILVDLPSILEAMKSWEKKNWWKSADVCQMLLVLGQCKSEEEASTYQLPIWKGKNKNLDERTWQWAHGITPPMRWCRKSRFRKRISVRAVEEDEAEVERLLRADKECVDGTSKYRLFNSLDEYDREQSLAQDDSEEGAEDEDAEGEVDEEVVAEIPAAEDEDEDDLAMEMERAMAEQADEDAAAASASAAATPQETSDVPQSPALVNVQTTDSPAAATSSGDDESEEESDEDEEEAAPAEDPDDVEAAQEVQRQREEIADLEAAIAREKEALARTTNAILRSKIVRRVDSLEADLEVRKRAMGGEEEGGD